jgi:hypothetical protein
MQIRNKFRFPELVAVTGKHWSNASHLGSTIEHHVSSVFTMRRTSDPERVLEMLGEYGLTFETLRGNGPFEREQSDTGLVARAVFFGGYSLGIEIQAPPSFAREAKRLLEAYAASIRRKLAGSSVAGATNKAPGPTTDLNRVTI